MPRPTSGSDAAVYSVLVEPLARNMPNLVTTVGIVVAFYLARNLAQGGSMRNAILLASTMAVLDCLDGAIARTCGLSSKFGATYDVVADVLKNAMCLAGIVLYMRAHGMRWDIVLFGTAVLSTSAYFAYRHMTQPGRSTALQQFFYDNTVLITIGLCVIVKVLM